MKPLKEKVVIAMSGGVDSSVAAALAKEEGYEVVGVTMKLLPACDPAFGCCGSPEDLAVAKRAAEKIGIPHYVLDFSPDFEKDVINYFVDSYIHGETPNPCIACNRHIKFEKLAQFAQSLNALYLATGHYARIVSKNWNGKIAFHLFEASDKSKDQSYVLYNLNQNNLSRTLFPLADLKKTEVRSLAKKLGLPNFDKKDSQEICFIPGKDYVPFVLNKLKGKGKDINTVNPGPILDSSGQKIGEHRGVSFYTIGQRKGLGLTVPEPVYVVDLIAETNTIVVGPEMENFAGGLIAGDINWVLGAPPDTQFSAEVKIRYKHEPAKATVSVNAETVEVCFEEPQRSVTPGQSAVFYRWNEKLKCREVIGGGKIIKKEK